MTRSALTVLLLTASCALAADWPQWGGGPTRNPVSPEKGLPLDFRFRLTDDNDKVTQEERGVAWKVKLGHLTVIPPVVADGLVWVGTNARYPGDEAARAKDWDGGVLMCLRESDGKSLWEHRSPRLSGKGVDPREEFPGGGLGSAPMVEGDRLWYVNNRSEVVCFDIAPLKKGAGKPAEVWKLDMRKELGVFPHMFTMNCGFAASVTGYKDRLYVVTHNGIKYETEGPVVPAPDAPSLVCLEKATGKVVWKDASPGKNILHCQFSSPLVAEVGGKAQVVVGQGDGWLRSFDAATGKLIWKCDLNPKDSEYGFDQSGDRNYVVATPIFYDGRVYVANGREIEHGPGPGALYCVDPTKTGDVSLELEVAPKKGKANPNSAVVWHTPRAVPADAPRIEVGTKKKRDLLRSRGCYFGRSISGCVAHDGLVYAADVGGFVFCFDARTGKLYWADDTRDTIRGQLLWADSKVLVCGDGGTLIAFAHGKEKKLLARIESTGWFYSGAVFANGTLYLTSMDTLYAIRNPK